MITDQIGRHQEPITRSLHANCTLESTLSCIFIFRTEICESFSDFFREISQNNWRSPGNTCSEAEISLTLGNFSLPKASPKARADRVDDQEKPGEAVHHLLIAWQGLFYLLRLDSSKFCHNKIFHALTVLYLREMTQSACTMSEAPIDWNKCTIYS